MFTKISAIMILLALSACSSTSGVSDLYTAADMSGWSNFSAGCADAYCMSSR